MCRDFMAGKCQRVSCRFLHAGSTAQKTQICGDFTRGLCTRGDACRYSHSLDVADNYCRDFQAGLCSRGDECRYSHDPPKMKCRDFAAGKCMRAKCKFLHEGAGSYEDQENKEEAIAQNIAEAEAISYAASAEEAQAESTTSDHSSDELKKRKREDDEDKCSNKEAKTDDSH